MHVVIEEAGTRESVHDDVQEKASDQSHGGVGENPAFESPCLCIAQMEEGKVNHVSRPHDVVVVGFWNQNGLCAGEVLMNGVVDEEASHDWMKSWKLNQSCYQSLTSPSRMMSRMKKTLLPALLDVAP